MCFPKIILAAGQRDGGWGVARLEGRKREGGQWGLRALNMHIGQYPTPIA